MKLKFMKTLLLLLFAADVLLSGCATEVATSSRRYVWPIPPDQPRIEWIKSYYSQHDFPKTGFDNFMEGLFGQARPIVFEKPIDIKSNGKGVVYVTDIVKGAIHVFDLVHHTVTEWKKGDDPDKTMAVIPYFLSIDSLNNIYVVGVGRKVVYVLDQNGNVSGTIDFSAKIDGAAGIAVEDRLKRIYIVDNTGGKVAVFSLSGKYLFSFGKPGEGNGEFNRPTPIIINRKGEVVVGDVMNARVQIFDSEGKFLRKFGQRGDGIGDFQVIKGVASDSDNNIYVTDGKANQIKIFNDKGELLMAFGKAHSVPVTLRESPGGFLLPQGIFIDATDTIYMADQANMRFQVFKYLKEEEKNEGTRRNENKM